MNENCKIAKRANAFRCKENLTRFLVTFAASLTLALGGVPAVAFADLPQSQEGVAQATQSTASPSNSGTDASSALATGTSDELSALFNNLNAQETSGMMSTMALLEPTTYPEGVKTFAIAFPTMSNSKKDIYATAMYTDDFFAKPSSQYDENLAYASACFAASTFNSNMYGDDYSKKSVNICSFLQNIGCKNIEINEGYKHKPMDAAPVGVAIGSKDITVDGKNCKLIAVGIRGGNYEREWAGNMRVGNNGNHLGWTQARDEVVGRLTEYIDKYTQEGDNLKVWIAGYSRSGATANLVGGLLSGYVAESGDSYGSGRTMDVCAWDYDKDLLTNTASHEVNIDKRHLTPNDIYCYSVNAPQGAESKQASEYRANKYTVGVHNLINPDDWIPQVAPKAWGFSRFGTDHDITGAYSKDESFENRTKSIRDTGSIMDDMLARLKTIDPSTSYTIPNFRQYGISKTKTGLKAYGKAVIYQFMPGLLIPKIWGGDTALDRVTETLTVSEDSSGAGNRYYSKGAELKHNQGAYYSEFISFFIDALGVDRSSFAINYQEHFEWLASTFMGMSASQQSQLGAAVQKAASKHVPGKFTILVNLSDYAKGDAPKTADLIKNILQDTLKDLGVSYNGTKLTNASNKLGATVAKLYAKEQEIGLFNFYHLITLGQNLGAIGGAHWPEVNLSYFKWARGTEASQFTGGNLTTQSSGESELDTQDAGSTHTIVYSFQGEGSYAFKAERDNGEILGVLPVPDDIAQKECVISWQLKKADGTSVEVGSDYVISEEDPAVMYLWANVVPLWEREVRFYYDWEESYSQDNLVTRFNVEEGGSVSFTMKSLTEENPWAEETYDEPQREGYTFECWRTEPDENGDVIYYSPNDIVYDEALDEEGLNLYAMWSDNAMWISNYHANCDGADPKIVSWEEPGKNDGIEIASNSFTREGYTFAGWNTKADGTGKAYAPGQVVTLEELGLPSRDESRAMITALTEDDEDEALRVIDEISTDLYAQWTVNPKPKITVKKKTMSVSRAKAKKGASFKMGARTTSNGKLTYKVVSKNKHVKFKKGKVTLVKGTYKKGRTFKIKVKVTSAKTSEYAQASKAFTLSFRIK